MNLTPQQIETFWSNVDQKGKDECWTWTGAKYGSMGYGRIRFNNRTYPAHRISYFLVFGEMPNADLDTCHSCDNPQCVNPHHVSECTRQRNMQEAVLRGRISTQKLTVQDVLDIRSSNAKGKILAEVYGVTPPTISKIRKRITWSFI